MKQLVTAGLGVLLFFGVSQAADKVVLKNESDNINYSVGYQVGGDFKRQGWEVNPEVLVQGILDASRDSEPLLSPEAMQATLANLKKRLVAEQLQAAKQETAAFLAENAKRPGVVVLPSGVQYRELTAGSGPRPTLADSVTIKYRMHRLMGKELVADQRASDPKSYALKQALPGLQEVLQLMPTGATWQVVLPPGPAMAVKDDALERAGALIYDLELISVQSGK